MYPILVFRKQSLKEISNKLLSIILWQYNSVYVTVWNQVWALINKKRQDASIVTFLLMLWVNYFYDLRQVFHVPNFVM